MKPADRINTDQMRSFARRLCANVITGPDWPNSQDELDRLDCTRAMHRAADELDNLYKIIDEAKK